MVLVDDMNNLFYTFAELDECLLKTHDCDANANCTNTVGSFTCKCNRNNHYFGNGKTCSHYRKLALLLKTVNE